MQQFEPLKPGHFYHIYNHGVGGRDLFRHPENYEYFIGLYDKYIPPVAETYAWCLMPNHFHLLVRIKKNICYKYSNADGSIDSVRFNEHKWQTTDLSECQASDSVKTPSPEKHFSHLFNAFARYTNIKYGSRGALFERPFKRQLIDNDNYLQRVVVYIHNNPVHHGFCKHPIEYPWSSYLSCLSNKSTKLQRSAVIDWFDGETNFINNHGQIVKTDEIDKWLEL